MAKVDPCYSVQCPACGAPKHHRCKSANGKKTADPHIDRRRDFQNGTTTPPRVPWSAPDVATTRMKSPLLELIKDRNRAIIENLAKGLSVTLMFGAVPLTTFYPDGRVEHHEDMF